MPTRTSAPHLVCFACEAPFTVSGADPICPACGADQRESPHLTATPEGRRGRLASFAKVIEPIEPESDDGASQDDADEDAEDEDEDDA